MEVTAILEQMKVKKKSVHKSRKMLRSSIDDICRFYIKATLYIMRAYAIVAKNGDGVLFYANNVRFPIDGDVVVMIP